MSADDAFRVAAVPTTAPGRLSMYSTHPAFHLDRETQPGSAPSDLEQALQLIRWVASSTAPEPMFLDEVVRDVARALGVPLCKVVELDSTGSWFTVIAGVGWLPGVIGSGFIPSGSSTQAGLTVALGTPLVCSDLSRAHWLKDATLLRRQGVASSVSAVVGHPDAPLGVLSAHSMTRRDFTFEETRFLARAAVVLGRGLQQRRQQPAFAFEHAR
jgi:hypothetical protein